MLMWALARVARIWTCDLTHGYIRLTLITAARDLSVAKKIVQL